MKAEHPRVSVPRFPTKEQSKIIQGIAYLRRYFVTYDRQYGWYDYTKQTMLSDILYALGVMMQDHPKQYEFADGFVRFKIWLIHWLQSDPNVQRELEKEKT